MNVSLYVKYLFKAASLSGFGVRVLFFAFVPNKVQVWSSHLTEGKLDKLASLANQLACFQPGHGDPWHIWADRVFIGKQNDHQETQQHHKKEKQPRSHLCKIVDCTRQQILNNCTCDKGLTTPTSAPTSVSASIFTRMWLSGSPEHTYVRRGNYIHSDIILHRCENYKNVHCRSAIRWCELRSVRKSH